LLQRPAREILSVVRWVSVLALVACGARTELAGVLDADAGADVHVGLDASHDVLDDADAIAATCGETQNTQSPPAPLACNQGITWLAWEYIPAHSFTTGAIELFTNDGSVALLDSSGTEPGGTLATGELAPKGEPTTWKTAQLSQDVALVAGHRYFIAERVERCSVATSGTEYAYFGASSLSGAWTGPFHSWAFTSRIDCGQ
jgi:hypothetical protein